MFCNTRGLLGISLNISKQPGNGDLVIMIIFSGDSVIHSIAKLSISCSHSIICDVANSRSCTLPQLI